MIKSLGALLLAACSIQFAHANDFDELAKKCAPLVSLDTLNALVKTESGFNRFAIGVVGESIPQPKNYEEALSAIEYLLKEKKDFSVGLGQINQSNFKRLDTNAEKLLEPCENLKATQVILTECYERTDKTKSQGGRLADALSLYYSGNKTTGYKHGYVDKVANNATLEPVVPSIKFLTDFMQDSKEPFVVSAQLENQSLTTQDTKPEVIDKKNSKLIF